MILGQNRKDQFKDVSILGRTDEIQLRKLKELSKKRTKQSLNFCPLLMWPGKEEKGYSLKRNKRVTGFLSPWDERAIGCRPGYSNMIK